MKDDYLWDKSGEPDPEIEHLERVLSQLRSTRGAQELMPAFEKLPRRGASSLTKFLAVAAALAFVLLALGVFSFIQRQSVKPDAGDSKLVMAKPSTPAPPVTVQAPAEGSGEIKQAKSDAVVTVGTPVVKSVRPPLQSRLRTTNRQRESTVNEREQSEGLMAKEQLLKALEITSSELDFVQKKVQGDEKQGPSS